MRALLPESGARHGQQATSLTCMYSLIGAARQTKPTTCPFRDNGVSQSSNERCDGSACARVFSFCSSRLVSIGTRFMVMLRDPSADSRVIDCCRFSHEGDVKTKFTTGVRAAISPLETTGLMILFFFFAAMVWSLPRWEMSLSCPVSRCRAVIGALTE